MKITNYNKGSYLFREVIASYLNVEYLEDLHSFVDKEYSVFDVETDQSTVFHKLFYKSANKEDSDFYRIYKEFIYNEVTEEMGSDIIYQKYPTFRTHLPNNLGVGAFHKDKDYNHGESEVNFWIPVTDAWGTNTIWCESEEDLGDYEPIEVKHGQVLKFNGATLSHGNKINDTGATRVSFDFRVVKKSEFKSSGKETISQGKKFDIGDYFEELE